VAKKEFDNKKDFILQQQINLEKDSIVNYMDPPEAWTIRSYNWTQRSNQEANICYFKQLPQEIKNLPPFATILEINNTGTKLCDVQDRSTPCMNQLTQAKTLKLGWYETNNIWKYKPSEERPCYDPNDPYPHPYPNPDEPQKPNYGMIFGIIAAIVVVLAIIVAIYTHLKKRKKQQERMAARGNQEINIAPGVNQGIGHAPRTRDIHIIHSETVPSGSASMAI